MTDPPFPSKHEAWDSTNDHVTTKKERKKDKEDTLVGRSVGAVRAVGITQCTQDVDEPPHERRKNEVRVPPSWFSFFSPSYCSASFCFVSVVSRLLSFFFVYFPVDSGSFLGVITDARVKSER